jgi:F0F1-type ATP synthase assembly protein I
MGRGNDILKLAGKYSHLAFILPASVFVGYAIGYMLDKYFGTNFWYLVWLLIGIAAGMRDLIRKTMVEFPADLEKESEPRAEDDERGE